MKMLYIEDFTKWVILWDIHINIRYYCHLESLRENMSNLTLKVSMLAMSILLGGCGAADNSDRKGAKPQRDPSKPQTPAATAADVNPRSQVFRNTGTAQITYAQEAGKLTITTNDAGDITATAYPGNMRDIPRMTTDIDNADFRRPAEPSNLDCGVKLENPTIAGRYADCKKQNPADSKIYKWDGKDKGIAGEGNWQLIAKSDRSLVWQDMTTGLLWSDALPTTSSCKKASRADGTGPDRICNIDPKAPLPALGKISKKEVYWRLPTRNDFLQADINGARYVLPNVDKLYWTANYKGMNLSTSNQEAWAITQKTGVLSIVNIEIDNQVHVRCVGVVTK